MPVAENAYTLGMTGSDAQPLSLAQQKALSDAERAASMFSLAPKLAFIDGVGLLLAAALSLSIAAFDPGFLISAALLACCGVVELTYANKLKAYDPVAPRVLALNQLALLLAITSYAVVRLMAAGADELTLEAALREHPELEALAPLMSDPAMQDQLDAMAGAFRTGMIVVYASLIVVSLLVQGGAALYYLSRAKYLQQFLETTPPWVLEWMRRRKR